MKTEITIKTGRIYKAIRSPDPVAAMASEIQQEEKDGRRNLISSLAHAFVRTLYASTHPGNMGELTECITEICLICDEIAEIIGCGEMEPDNG